MSRDIDCYSLAKISEILEGANILSTPIFCRRQYFVDANIYDVFSMADRYNKPVQCVRESAHKSRAASGNKTLGDCMWRDQHLLGDVGEHQRGLGEVSCCGLCRTKQYKDTSAPAPTFRRREYFVDRVFCRREYYVNAIILSTRVFCWNEYFVNASILSTRVFCRREYFVDASILLTRVFCRRQQFVDASILSTPTFCHRQYFLSTRTFL